MAKIKAMGVEWYTGFANSPDIVVLVDEMVEDDKFRYDWKDGIYYAEAEGFVRFLFYRSPGEGFDGHTFTLKMKDGSTHMLKGPWSSNSGAVNKRGFGPCKEVFLMDDEENFHDWKKGGNLAAIFTNMTISALEEGMKLFLPGLELVKQRVGSEALYTDVYMIAYKGFTPEQSKKTHEKDNSIQSIKDTMSKDLFGITVTSAREGGICVNCRKGENLSKEWLISGLCDKCFDQITKKKTTV